MKRRNLLVPTIVAGIGIVAYAAGQMVITSNGSGLGMRENGAGYGSAISQLWSHAQLLENEVVTQKRTIAQLEKDVKDQQDKYAKLERRVRNMELRGK